MGAKDEHREYIASEAWRNRRADYLAKFPYCAECGMPRRFAPAFYGEDLHVHHVSYARVGGVETDEDLQSLCKRCHEVKSLGYSALKEFRFPWHSPAGVLFLLGEIYKQEITSEYVDETLEFRDMGLTQPQLDSVLAEIVRTLDRLPNPKELIYTARRIKEHV